MISSEADRVRVYLILICLLLSQVRAQNLTNSQSKIPDGQRQSDDTCSSVKFTNVGEMFSTFVRDPFKVRQGKGRAINRRGDWPDGVEILVEFLSRAEDQKLYRTHADAKGRFEIRNLPEGEYCFKVIAEGWQSVYGIAVISKKADHNTKIVVQMDLDE